MNYLPKSHRVLEKSIKYEIPGFLKHYHSEWKTFAPEEIDCQEWFYQFVERIKLSRGTEFLPVCRLSDGEYKFLLGTPPVSPRVPISKRLYIYAKRYLRRYLKPSGFQANTRPQVSSGSYSKQEWEKARTLYGEGIKWLAESGILAMHLSYFKRPTIEHYFKPLKEWLRKEQISLTLENYVPFYFVYALLLGPKSKDILGNQRILVIHSAKDGKRDNIKKSLLHEEAKEVQWLEISASRSLFDKIDISQYIGKIDLCVLGAGVGKVNLFPQLQSLGVPCIDAGYVFEVWADSENRWNRSFCVPDDMMDFDKITFMDTDEVAQLKHTWK